MIALILFLVALIGWALVIGIILSLTGLQKKLMQASGAGSGMIVSKKVKIPFIGEAEVTSVANDYFQLKIKKRR